MDVFFENLCNSLLTRDLPKGNFNHLLLVLSSGSVSDCKKIAFTYAPCYLLSKHLRELLLFASFQYLSKNICNDTFISVYISPSDSAAGVIEYKSYSQGRQSYNSLIPLVRLYDDELSSHLDPYYHLFDYNINSFLSN